LAYSSALTCFVAGRFGHTSVLGERIISSGSDEPAHLAAALKNTSAAGANQMIKTALFENFQMQTIKKLCLRI
jgi:hypothetical protein